MSDKIQMTEEQKDQLLNDLGISGSTGKNYYGEKLRNAGYIIKSEIEQKIEEADEMYKQWQMLVHDDTLDINFQLIVKYHEAVQLLKPYYYNSKEEKK